MFGKKKIDPNQNLIDLQNAAIALGRCGLSIEQALQNIKNVNDTFNLFFLQKKTKIH